MNLFLLWSTSTDRGRPLVAEDVAASLGSIFSPVVRKPIVTRTLTAASASLAYLDIPVKSWLPSFFQEDEETWALAIDYPMNMRAALGTNGNIIKEDHVLLELCRGLEKDPERLLKELAPPFSLIWSNKRTGELFVQNDGLGQSQLFEYEDDKTWVLTNRISALKACGITPEPHRDEWATRLTLGWFPLQMTGFKNTRFLEAGTQIRIDRGGVHRSTRDVLSSWVRPQARTKKDCLELATESLISMIDEVKNLWETPSVGLSGGRDSRALVALLRARDVDCNLRVRGNPKRYDVMIAAELARIANLEIRIKPKGGIPPDTYKRCKRSIKRALLWQSGYMPTVKHKTFLVRHRKLKRGMVNVMGSHGGLGKADFATKINAHELNEEEYEPKLIELLMQGLPSFTRVELRDQIRDTLVQAYRQADRYGLTGLARLHFFFLNEYTRRWASASLSSEANLIFAPYLNPDFIRACYAYPERELASRPFHRHITKTYAPEWADYPYDSTVEQDGVQVETVKPLSPDLLEEGSRVFEESRWKPRGHYKKYHYRKYWRLVGKPLVRQARREEGFHTEIFDPVLIRERWREGPDALVIAHLLPSVLDEIAT